MHRIVSRKTYIITAMKSMVGYPKIPTSIAFWELSALSSMPRKMKSKNAIIEEMTKKRLLVVVGSQNGFEIGLTILQRSKKHLITETTYIAW